MAHRSRVFTHCSPPPLFHSLLMYLWCGKYLENCSTGRIDDYFSYVAVVGAGAEAGKDIQKCSVRILSLAHRVSQMNRPAHTPSFIHPLTPALQTPGNSSRGRTNKTFTADTAQTTIKQQNFDKLLPCWRFMISPDPPPPPVRATRAELRASLH